MFNSFIHSYRRFDLGRKGEALSDVVGSMCLVHMSYYEHRFVAIDDTRIKTFSIVTHWRPGLHEFYAKCEAIASGDGSGDWGQRKSSVAVCQYRYLLSIYDSHLSSC
jgi:hypothetical protein